MSNPDAISAIVSHGDLVQARLTGGRGAIYIHGKVETWDTQGIALSQVKGHEGSIEIEYKSVFIPWATILLIAPEKS